MPNKRDASGQKLLTVKQVAKLAGVDEKLVVSHIQEPWARQLWRGDLERRKPYLPIRPVTLSHGRPTYRIAESAAMQFKASKPGKVLPLNDKGRPYWGIIWPTRKPLL